MRCLVCVVGALALAAAARAQPVVLDDFSDLTKWRVITSDGVQASIAPAKNGDAPVFERREDVTQTAHSTFPDRIASTA